MKICQRLNGSYIIINTEFQKRTEAGGMVTYARQALKKKPDTLLRKQKKCLRKRNWDFLVSVLGLKHVGSPPVSVYKAAKDYGISEERVTELSDYFLKNRGRITGLCHSRKLIDYLDD